MKSKSKSFMKKQQVRKVEPKTDYESVADVVIPQEPEDCPCCKAECQCCDHASGRIDYKCTCRCHS